MGVDRVRRGFAFGVLVLLATAAGVAIAGLADADFEQPDTPAPFRCENPATPGYSGAADGCDPTFPDSWLGDFSMDQMVWAEGDVITLSYQPWFGLRTPDGQHEPEDSAPAWGQVRDNFFANPIACDDYDTTCTLRVVRGNFAPQPDDLGQTDPVQWSWVQPGIHNGIGPAGERLSMYVQPSYFWVMFRFLDEDGTPLPASNGVSARFTKLPESGEAYEGETVGDVLSRYFLFQFDQAGALQAFIDANPSHVGLTVDSPAIPGPVDIPEAEVIVESGSATSNILRQALRRGTHDVTFTDSGGRVFDPITLDITNANVIMDVQAEPDPLVVVAVRGIEDRTTPDPFQIEVDVRNVSLDPVTNVRSVLPASVVPAGGGGVSVSGSTPASIASWAPG